MHINLIPLIHVIGLAPLRGNPTPSQDWEDYFLPNLHRKEKLTSLGGGRKAEMFRATFFTFGSAKSLAH
ncbi:MAG TPA: hypothetical protein EYH00_04545, partial [Archaeoglobus profundus]|nr:hypothetical protein [Archaeoglobus profundus]